MNRLKTSTVALLAAFGLLFAGCATACAPAYVPVTHTVTFVYGNGQPDATEEVVHGEKIQKPADPFWAGFDFEGWYYQDEKWSFAGDIVTEDMTLTAKWESYLQYGSLDGSSWLVIGCSDDAERVYVPDTYQGLPVVGIYDEAFEDHTSLLFVNISEGIVVILDAAFAGCESLAAAYIPASVMLMGDDVFVDCPDLTIFCEAPEESYNWGDWNPDHADVLWSSKAPLVIDGLIYVPFITDEGSFALVYAPLYWESIKTADIAATVSDGETDYVVIGIGGYAFAYCESLESVFIPANVSMLGDDIFYDCISLTSIVIDEGNETYTSGPAGSNCIIERSTNKLVVGCKGTVIPGTVSAIDDYAFSGCRSLPFIFIPETVVAIGHCAFEECSSLKIFCEVDGKPSGWAADWNPDDRDVFWSCAGCVSVDGIIYFGVHDVDDIAIVVGAVSQFAIKDAVILDSVNIGGTDFSVIFILDEAFDECISLRSVRISASVEEIDDYAFADCPSLASVTFEDDSHLAYIGNATFAGCLSLTSIYIPASVEGIGNMVFSFCPALSEIVVDEDNETYASGPAGSNCILDKDMETLFVGCKNTVLPDTVETIDVGAFYGCISLEAYVIPSSVITLGGYSFAYCESLETIYIPASVETIQANVFSYCPYLTIYCEIAQADVPSGWVSNWNCGHPVIWDSHA